MLECLKFMVKRMYTDEYKILDDKVVAYRL